MKNFYFKARSLRSTIENFKSIDTRLKNIITTNFYFVDTSEKIFVENFEFVEIDNFVETNVIFKNKTTIIDDFCFEIDDESTIIINDLNFDERFNFFF